MTPPISVTGAWERLACYQGGTVADLSAALEPDGQLTIFVATPAGVSCSSDAGQFWRSCGPVGRLPFVTSVAPSPAFAEDRTVFAGTLAGLFRSRDGGDSWQPVLAGGGILAVALSPAYLDDRTVFVGTADDGILRSEDGGDRWISANAGLLDLSVQALALSDRFPENGSAFAGTATGLYRSRNGGKSWQEVDLGLDEVSVQAVRVGPRVPGASWIVVATEEHGVLLSDDDGKRWFDVPEFTGQGVTAVATWATSSGQLGLDVAVGQSVVRSVDGGESWRTLGTPPAPVLSLLSITSPAGGDTMETLAGLVGEGVVRLSGADSEPAPSNAGLDATVLTMLALSPSIAQDSTLFAASVDGTLLVSRDGGQSHTRLSPPLSEPSVTGLAVSPHFRDDHTVWLSTSGTLLRSHDAGESWTTMPCGPPAGTPADDTEDAAPRLFCVARGEGQTSLFVAVGPTVGCSDDGGKQWRWLGAVDNRQEVVGLAALRRRNGDHTLYAATRGSGETGQLAGQTVWRSDNGGHRWERWLDVEADGQPVLLSWDGPPSEPNLVVAVGRTVFLPRTDARERRGALARPFWWAVTLAPSVLQIVSLATPLGPLAGRTIYSGTNAGVYVSRDGGRSFAGWDTGRDEAGVMAVAAASEEGAGNRVYAVGPGGAIWHRYDG